MAPHPFDKTPRLEIPKPQYMEVQGNREREGVHVLQTLHACVLASSFVDPSYLSLPAGPQSSSIITVSSLKRTDTGGVDEDGTANKLPGVLLSRLAVAHNVLGKEPIEGVHKRLM